MPPKKKVIQATPNGVVASPRIDNLTKNGETNHTSASLASGPLTRKRQRDNSDEGIMHSENDVSNSSMGGDENLSALKVTAAALNGFPISSSPMESIKPGNGRGAGRGRGRGAHNGVGRAIQSYVNPEVATGLPPSLGPPMIQPPLLGGRGRPPSSRAIKGEPGLTLPPTPVSQPLSDAMDERSRPAFHNLPAAPGTDRGSKGLRHFSAKVCQKVEEKGCTTYNEVADELVAEMNSPKNFDQKNIRRRVYDALNVLMAMGIIRKDKKEIRWCGMPRNGEQRIAELQGEAAQLRERVKRKQEEVSRVLCRFISVKNLVTRNRNLELEGVPLDQRNQIQLPFLLTTAPSDTQIQCEMTEDRSEFFFDFAGPFSIHEDLEVLNLLKLDCISEEEVRSFVPEDLARYLPMDALRPRRDEEVNS